MAVAAASDDDGVSLLVWCPPISPNPNSPKRSILIYIREFDVKNN